MQQSSRINAIIVWGAILVASGNVYAATPLPRGKDVINVPALVEGLCVHNVFQSRKLGTATGFQREAGKIDEERCA